MRARMAPGNITISIEGAGANAVPRLDPGSRISGRVAFVPESETTIDAIHIEVRWRTSGKGNEDGAPAWLERHELPPPERKILPGMALDRSFECDLPGSPWSYDGKLVKIAWEVAVRLDLPWAVDLKASREFVMRPEAAYRKVLAQ